MIYGTGRGKKFIEREAKYEFEENGMKSSMQLSGEQIHARLSNGSFQSVWRKNGKNGMRNSHLNFQCY